MHSKGNHKEDEKTTLRMVVIKKTTNKCWPKCGEKGTLVHCWRECKLVQPLWKTVRKFLKKLKIEIPYGPEIALLGKCTSEENKNTNLKRYMHPYVHCSTIYNCQDMEAT